ncbi:MAG: single-stranded-DNA-specific exonuclease RecJ [Candidatus Cloacimonadota bacterium]|nr:MAG: single-stranded-DNA-specific exonuclease RecJ [Candidatus Cloacimonadota bacterium]
MSEVYEHCCKIGFDPLVSSFIDSIDFINNIDDLKSFLNKNKKELHSPFLLSDIDKALGRIKKAFEKNEKVVIFGDFDSDGVSATCIMYWGLRKAKKGFIPEVFFPNRLSEGHGLQKEHIDRFKQDDISLIITVDCGMGDKEAITLAQSIDIDVIVVDHHMADEEMDYAFAVVNPRHNGYPFPFLAGAGVSYKLVQALHSSLFGENSLEHKDVSENLLDYLVIGTIGDLVSMTGENRILVSQGLLHMNQSKFPFLKDFWQYKILKKQLNEVFNEEHISFYMAPRINAASRLEDAKHAFNFLTAVHPKKLIECGDYIEGLNENRRERLFALEKSDKLEVFEFENIPLVLVNTHSNELGLLGLLASRFNDIHEKSAIVLGSKNDETFTASCRGDGNLHFFEILTSLNDLLTKYGGHKAAAGFSLKVEDFDELIKRLKQIKYIKPSVETKFVQKIDIEIDASKISEGILDQILSLGPFGEGFRKPLLKITNSKVAYSKQIGKDGSTLSFSFRGQNNVSIRGIAFGFGDKVEEIKKSESLIGYLGYNYFYKKEMQLRLVDFELT